MLDSDDGIVIPKRTDAETEVGYGIAPKQKVPGTEAPSDLFVPKEEWQRSNLDGDDGIAIPQRTEADVEIVIPMAVEPILLELVHLWPNLTESEKTLVLRAYSSGLERFDVPASDCARCCDAMARQYQASLSAPNTDLHEYKSAAKTFADLGSVKPDHQLLCGPDWPTEMPCDLRIQLFNSVTRVMKAWDLHRNAGMGVLLDGVWHSVKQGRPVSEATSLAARTINAWRLPWNREVAADESPKKPAIEPLFGKLQYLLDQKGIQKGVFLSSIARLVSMLNMDDLGTIPPDHEMSYHPSWPSKMPCDLRIHSFNNSTRVMKVWDLHRNDAGTVAVGPERLVLLSEAPQQFWYGVKRAPD